MRDEDTDLERVIHENSKLREETLLAFARAVSTDRMVAVTGALSTRALGYPSWTDFIRKAVGIARELATSLETRRGLTEPRRRREAEIIHEIRAHADMLLQQGAGPPDPRVGLWKLHDAFRRLDARMRRTRAGLVIAGRYEPLAIQTFEASVAELFTRRASPPGTAPTGGRPSALRPLIENLGIKRFATLNYDLELERALMLRRDERDVLKAAAKRHTTSDPRTSGAADDRPRGSVLDFVGPSSSGRPIVAVTPNIMTRTMGHGMVVESDIVNRERPDRLFEFAVGSSETSAHILHLHGRADIPGSLIANIRQYDRLYRLDDLYRDPFDHSLKVLFGGNPILFVGIGMTEEELNRTLQYYVSNAPVRRPAPMFLIWNTTGVPPEERIRFMQSRRLDFRRRLGVHVIFEEDLRPPSSTSEPMTPAQQQVADPEIALNALADRASERLTALLAPFRAVTTLKDPSPSLAAFAREAAKIEEAIVSNLSPGAPPADLPAAEEQALVRSLAALPPLVARLDGIPAHGAAWRRIEQRFENRDAGSCGYRMWGALGLSRMVADQDCDAELKRLHGNGASHPSPLIFAAARQGFGRGELGERLMRMGPGDLPIDRETLRSTQPHNRLLVNAGFSYDSDAVLVGIARFLNKRGRHPERTDFCREALFASGELFSTLDDVLIVINGADRFFGFDGTPLSAELDHMLRCAQRGGRVQFLLLGTERMRPYCEAIGSSLQTLSAEPPAETSNGSGSEPAGEALTFRLQALTGRGHHPLKSSYLDWIADRFMARAEEASRRPQDAPEKRTLSWPEDYDITEAAAKRIGDALRLHPDQLTRTFYDAYLAPSLLRMLGINCPATFEVLRTMSFIGAPVDAPVLLYAPKVRAILGETEEGTDQIDDAGLRSGLEAVLKDLHDLGLIIAFEPHDESRAARSAKRRKKKPSTSPDVMTARFGLHRSLATYLRDRHGVPINDAKLATTFNMSLFTSEPGDSYSPDPDFHDELGHLVDDLVGAWHDIGRDGSPGSTSILTAEQRASVSERELQAIALHPDDAEQARRSLDVRSSRIASACLRAALSLVRGYYSTSSLLKFDRDDRLAQPDRDGALTEHAQRLDRIMRGFAATMAARDIVRSLTRKGDKLPKKVLRHLGPEPFYEDDLVWLQNERGVVALAQGHLFDAVRALGEAKQTNRLIEIQYHGHNWRRLSLNMVAALIERADLKPAEKLLDRIEQTINAPAWLGDEAPGQGSRLDGIRDLLRRSDTPPIRGDRLHSREELLITAMVTGYRGLIAQIRGRYHEARTAYLASTEMLRRLGEQRAYAHFQRHYASLQSFIGDKESARQEIEYGIAAAVSARQMDILHRSSVVRADIVHALSADANVRRNALEDVKKALRYSTLSDCYRVRIEASASLARHMRHGGDYDTALRYAADGLTIASRYGHSLQKTSLRIEVGRILQQRGDPRSGKALLDKAVEIGSGKGHQQALERVRRADSDDGLMPLPSNRTDITVSLGDR